MKIGKREFELGKHTYVMGILNITPDSFSDGGMWNTLDNSLMRVEAMVEEGADIIDIGGESTRPGYKLISEEEEIERITSIIRSIKERFEIPISLDTYKSKVARAGIAEGVDLINDIWGLQYDSQMKEVIAESKLPCCLMHNRNNADYNYFITNVINDLKYVLDTAQRAGIEREKIILDPGVGFAKSHENNLEIINKLELLHELKCPILLGTSRKSVIGQALDLPVGDRLEGTLVTTVFAVMKGCSFVRVHDIKSNVRAIRMAESILNI